MESRVGATFAGRGAGQQATRTAVGLKAAVAACPMGDRASAVVPDDAMETIQVGIATMTAENMRAPVGAHIAAPVTIMDLLPDRMTTTDNQRSPETTMGRRVVPMITTVLLEDAVAKEGTRMNGTALRADETARDVIKLIAIDLQATQASVMIMNVLVIVQMIASMIAVDLRVA